MQFVVVTGMSGSGKSSAVDVLEDMGYYCIDNMPPELIPKFANICSKSDGKITKVAFVVDIRGGDFFLQLNDTINELRSNHYDVKILFLDSNDDVIVRRYKETRRKHPLDEACSGNIKRAVISERDMLSGTKKIGGMKFFVTDKDEGFAKLGKEFLGEELSDVTRLEIEEL